MKRLILTALVVLALALSAGAAPKPLEQFSADQVMQVAGKSVTGKIYVDRGKVRTETQIPGMPQSTVTIVNGPRKVIWILMPGNMYMEKSIETNEDISHAAWTRPDKLESLGKETVDGVECGKYRIRDGGQEITYFISEQDGLPVRMVSADGKVRFDWKNVQKGPQPDHLFELPAGATKMALPNFPFPGMK